MYLIVIRFATKIQSMFHKDKPTTWMVEFADDLLLPTYQFSAPGYSMCCQKPIYKHLVKTRLSKALLLIHFHYGLLLPTQLWQFEKIPTQQTYGPFCFVRSLAIFRIGNTPFCICSYTNLILLISEAHLKIFWFSCKKISYLNVILRLYCLCVCFCGTYFEVQIM